MKIGINATFLYEKQTGACIFTRNLSRLISELNKETIIFSPFKYADLPDNCIYKVSEGMRGSKGFFNNLYRILYINSLLPMICKLKKVDILFCPIMEFPFIPLTPLVVHIHDLHYIYFPSEFGLAAPRMKFSLKIIDRVARRITVSSKFVKNELLKYTSIKESQIDVVPLAYNSDLFTPKTVDLKKGFLDRYQIKGEYILFVGSLFPYKNLKTLLKAFSIIKNRIPHYLVVVGRREFSSEPLTEGERIFYIDYVPEEDMPFFYSYADVFVYPSLMEGFGIPPLEAMACGTAVISSNGGSLPEIVGDAGMQFNPLDSEMLCNSILEVINNKRLRNELIEKGFRQANRFSWQKTAEGILQSCKKALEL